MSYHLGNVEKQKDQVGLGVIPANFLQKAFFFSAPGANRQKRAIYPIFLPFSGCPRRCLFCAQEVQTGCKTAPVRSRLAEAAAQLEERLKKGLPPLELAFFGGTFTALAQEDLHACLDFAVHWRRRKAVRAFRCSTRPDALNPQILAALKEAGCALVELGVQSYDNTALSLSQRGYTGEQARAACRLVTDSGLALGIQLMPGMPGLSRRAARADIEITRTQKPVCARLYPCLVFAGSPLENVWRAKAYTPWPLGGTVNFLASACLRLQGAGIEVIRMGVAEEPGMREHILAGPRHPALGNMVRSRSLYHYLKKMVRRFIPDASGAPLRLCTPQRLQGELWGHRKELVPAYTALGLAPNRITWWQQDYFALRAEI